MKTTFLILNFVFFTFHSFAQDNVFKNRILQRGNTVRNQGAQLRMEATRVSLDSAITSKKDKITFEYDANGFVNLELIYSWSSTKNNWIRAEKNEYINNYKGNIITSLFYEWNDTTNTWINIRKKEYAYDENSNELLDTEYKWDEISDEWIGNYRIENTFDSFANLLISTSFRWEKATKKWVGFYKFENVYDNYGNITAKSTTSWNSSFNDWSSISSTVNFNNTLNTINKPTVSIEYSNSSNVTYYYYKSEFSYDSYGNIILYISYNWRSALNDWMPSRMEAYVFDENGNRKEQVVYHWNDTTKTWLGSYKENYVFDKAILTSSLATPLIGKEFYNKVTSLILFDYSNGNWVEGFNYKFYYSSDPTRIEDQTLTASQKNVVKIFNQLGIEVKPEQVASGLYIYQYSDGSTRKVMRQE
jgi:hypothetical protein